MRVDGASYYRIFWSLMLPLSGPAIAIVFILMQERFVKSIAATGLKG